MKDIAQANAIKTFLLANDSIRKERFCLFQLS
jgi:hypothetical protein